MAFRDIFLNASARAEQSAINAAHVDSIPLASPYADNSHLETLTLADLYGITPDQLPVNRTSAMSIASVAKGRNLIATSIARMPLKSVRNGSPVADQPAFLKQLELGVPNFITLSWTVDSMLFYGRAFWLITEKTFDGRPLHIRFVPESQVETKDGLLVKAFGKNIGPNDYIRLDANNEGFLNYGQAVVREALAIEAASREAGENPVPAINLAQKEGVDLKQSDITALLARWSAARKRKGGSTSYTNKGVEVQTIGQHNENLLIDARNVASLQVARALGLPAWAVDASVQGTSLNYSNVSSRNRETIDALTAYMLSIEQTISMYLPTGTEVKFDTTEMLKADTKDRYDAYEVAIRAGVLTANEARSYENLEPLDEADATESNAEDLAVRGNFAGTLIRSGFDPNEAMATAGLNPVKHLGLLPVTLQPPAAGTDLENAVEPLEPLQDEPTESPVAPLPTTEESE